MKVIQCFGPNPYANGAQTVALAGRSDLPGRELSDFAVIGIDTMHRARGKAAETVSCGWDGRVVMLPRKTTIGWLVEKNWSL